MRCWRIGLCFVLCVFCNCFVETVHAECPVNFSVLQRFAKVKAEGRDGNTTALCIGAKNALHLALSEYLLSTDNFVPPLSSAEDCWNAFRKETRWVSDVRKACGFETEWIAEGVGCMNITTRKEFEKLIPAVNLNALAWSCNQSLTTSPCGQCISFVSSTQASYLRGTQVGNLTDCVAYLTIYTAAFLNHYGPLDSNTALCLFSIEKDSGNSKGFSPWGYGVIASSFVLCILVGILGFYYFRRVRFKKRKVLEARNTSFAASEPSTMNPNSTLMRFSIEEIKEATKNFSRENILGAGGYGNVYKGVLKDGSVVAVKRFKNFSPAGQSGFVHEVEVIASIRHRNLVSLKGFCVSAGSFEGHQRILVCEFMPNGSLHDHLFENKFQKRLDWPSRCRIALGMAKGLAYLHFEAQPAIIHRDIKANNILLDESFNARVADFGLARFAPEGVSHVTTRVAGTLGYLAPEYALYGQLTEKSDVYSFGVVLLELLSGRKAIPSNAGSSGSAQVLHISDWAWTLVRQGNTLEIIEKGIENPGSAESMERYVYIALLCAHPQLHCRPSMDQVVKILESEDQPVPHLPDRPMPLVTSLADVERSFSASSGSSHLTSPTGYQSFYTEGSFLVGNG